MLDIIATLHATTAEAMTIATMLGHMLPTDQVLTVMADAEPLKQLVDVAGKSAQQLADPCPGCPDVSWSAYTDTGSGEFIPPH